MEIPDHLCALTDAIHEGALDAHAWHDALDAIASQIDARHVFVCVAAPGAKWTSEEWHGVDVPFVRAYEDYFGRLDPIVPLAAEWRPGTLLTDEAALSSQFRARSEFYQEWVRPQGMRGVAVANFLCEDGIVGILGATRRTSRPYRQEHLDILVALMPHLRHAARIRRRLANASLRETIESDALSALSYGILIVDKDGRILFANREAESLLAKADGIRAGPAGLTTLTTSSTHLLRATISRATNAAAHLRIGGAMLIDRPRCDSPLQVLVSPLGSQCETVCGTGRIRAAMLCVIDSRHATQAIDEQLRALFRLTTAEARVASGIGQGTSPTDIADQLGVLPSTVRTHLHHIFAKTGTRRQAELMRLVAHISIARIDAAN